MSVFPQRQHLSRIPVWLPANAPVIYFVTACCAERQRFFADSFTVRIALESMQRIEARLGWLVEQICFMPDHVHLLLAPQGDRHQSLSHFMQRWKTSVGLRLGRKVWQREFFDHLLRSEEKLEEKWNYIRENPVRAGLCASAEDYPFSGRPKEILSRLIKVAGKSARTLNDRDSRPPMKSDCRAGTPTGLPAADEDHRSDR